MFDVGVYLGHDNPFSLTVKRGGTAVDLVATSVTRMVIKYGNTASEIIDSDVAGEGAGQPFDWATSGASGICEYDLGGQSIPVGTHECSLIIYDTLHPSGQVWDGLFRMVVKSQYV
jgi:hypothetical protein